MSDILEHDPRKLRWRSRRGTLELDLYLHRFIDTYLDNMTEDERIHYAHFLRLSDDVLINWVVEQQPVTDPHFQGLVAKILTH